MGHPGARWSVHTQKRDLAGPAVILSEVVNPFMVSALPSLEYYARPVVFIFPLVLAFTMLLDRVGFFFNASF